MKFDPSEIRPAVPEEVGGLSDLAMRSKAYWGYDASFMKSCLAELTVTPAYLRTNPTFVLEAGGRLLGLYSLEGVDPDDSGDAELGLFFVDPEYIGRGVGRCLMEDALSRALSMGLSRLVVQSDPHAESFYRAVGFVRTGESASDSLPGRKLPVLEIELAVEA